MTRVTSVCPYSAWKVYHLYRVHLVQCGPLEVRNRSQACIYGPRTRLCNENVWWTKSKRILTQSCQGLETHFWWGRTEAWCEFDNAFGPWASLVIMSTFALALARPCDFISSQYSMSMWFHFDHRLRLSKWFFNYVVWAWCPTLVRGQRRDRIKICFTQSLNEILIFHHVLVGFSLSFVHQLPKERAPSSNTFTLVSNTLLINLNWVDRCFLAT